MVPVPTLGRAGPFRSCDVAKGDFPLDYAPESRPDVPERTHVPWLLLRPDHFFEVRVPIHKVLQLILRESVKLLDPCDRDMPALLPPLFPDEVVIELAGAED